MRRRMDVWIGVFTCDGWANGLNDLRVDGDKDGLMERCIG